MPQTVDLIGWGPDGETAIGRVTLDGDNGFAGEFFPGAFAEFLRHVALKDPELVAFALVVRPAKRSST